MTRLQQPRRAHTALGTRIDFVLVFMSKPQCYADVGVTHQDKNDLVVTRFRNSQ